MMKKLFVALIVIVFHLCPVWASEIDSPHISVYGTATLNISPDQTIWFVNVLNKGRVDDLDGPETSITGTARVVDTSTNAKLAVRFDRPEIENIEFPYWIIDLGEEYDFAVVSNPTREVLYILNRTPVMDEDFYNDLVDSLVERGFEKECIELTPQPVEE